LCKVPETRALLEKAFASRCLVENTPIMEELVRLRHEEAQVLGYDTSSDYVLEIRMAKNKSDGTDSRLSSFIGFAYRD
jgi:Zn-dependent oligopeptidase